MRPGEENKKAYEPIIADSFLRWVVIVVFWTVFGLLMAWESYIRFAGTGTPLSVVSALGNELLYAYIWILLTPIICRLSWRFPLDGGRRLLHGATHLGLSVIVAIVHRMAFYVLMTVFTTGELDSITWRSAARVILWYLDYGVMLYWGLVLVQHAHGYFRRYRQNEREKSMLEAQLIRARLRALEMQLQPHFLFNTLNAISVLIQKNPDGARTMIGKLSDLLRVTLDRSSVQEVPLQEELKYLDCYLHIEQTRFEDRLTIQRDIDPQTLGAFVPTLLLQPIVENAMRHGVSHQPGPATVAIRAQKQNGFLRLQVEDTGPGLDETHSPAEGIGISNTRTRLRQLYGDGGSFELRNAAHRGGAVVTITIPFSTVPTQTP